ncbi:response regulator transcription factor [Corynebacterium incognita]|uniref:Response regulator transcription factor n=1 Tax=Corynebacterium incognita TaxID=2754725 RepID=A0A7G7CMP7_9CORY|nr:response regulator transcription factor [Corynebacterium incognita]QNE88863.1 response regulator transcription factor [Corynebacterium incognita]
MKIILAEDSALLLAGLSEVLRAAGHNVAKARDADELRSLAEQAPVDLVISDVRMPPDMTDDGVRAVRDIRSNGTNRGVPSIILSQYVAAAYLDEFLDQGGFGYLLKQRVSDIQEFLHAMDKVASGDTVVDPEVVSSLLRRQHNELSQLTSREKEVLQLMAEGMSNSDIGQRLFLTAGAVSKHIANIFLKLGFTPQDDNRRVRAVLTWLRHHAHNP